jgi:DNA topoisomerase I
MQKLVVVESPAKAKTINKYLGSDYVVRASFGHIRSLPSSDGSVEPDNDFLLHYENIARSQKHIAELVSQAKNSDEIILATDPDREGEAISWHVIEVLKAKKAIKKDTIIRRVAFNEITKKAVLAAVANPREIDLNLVNAQQARQALDYLVGFTLSPVLWRKLPGSRSAGRVQSVALRLIADREDEIERFNSQEYWDIKLDFLNQMQAEFTANLTHINSEKLDKFYFTNEESATNCKNELLKRNFSIINIEKKQVNRNPQPPFNTSSLQQDASRKLGFSTKKTMMIAQKLYEGVDIGGETFGLITYMRTDGVQISDDAVKSLRSFIPSQFGEEFLSPDVRVYKTKAKNAQEAHEAIRPTEFSYSPEKIGSHLESDYLKLYELIWKRTVASQMSSAVFDSMQVNIESSDKFATCRVTGSVLKFSGYLKLYQESEDDKKSDDEQGKLPELNIGEKLATKDVRALQHFTEPPPRFTEASLVKKLEELGIGRPSTYATIITVLQDREYVKLDKKRFIPEERGRIVTAFLQNFFLKYVEYNFSAQMEEKLDLVSDGKVVWKDMLKEFWVDFNSNIQEVGTKKITEVIDRVNESLENHFFGSSNPEAKKCPDCADGKLSLKLSKFGPFIGCSNYPTCKYTRKIEQQNSSETSEDSENPTSKDDYPILIGVDPESKLEINLRKGPYGLYLQLENPELKPKEKPKRATIPKFIAPDNITLDQASFLINLPKSIGQNADGEDILVNIGKFGPYLKAGSKNYPLKADMIFSVTLDEALAIIAKKDASPAKEVKKSKSKK